MIEGPMKRRFAKYATVILVTASCYSFSIAISIAAFSGPTAQVDSVAINVRQDSSISELTRRIGNAEDELKRLVPEVAVIEDSMSEIKWITRGGAAAIVSHMVMSQFGFTIARARRRRTDPNEENFDTKEG